MTDPKYKVYSQLLNVYKTLHTDKKHAVCVLEVSKLWDAIKNENNYDVLAKEEIGRLQNQLRKKRTTLAQFWNIKDNVEKDKPQHVNKPATNLGNGNLTIETLDDQLNANNSTINNDNENNVAVQHSTPAQDLIRKEIISLQIEIDGLQKKINAGIGSDDDQRALNRKTKALKDKKQNLHTKELAQIRQKRKRDNFRNNLQSVCEDNPELRKKLKVRSTVGRPSIENDQPGFLEAIIDIALLGSATDERRRSELTRTVKTLTQLTTELQKLGYDVKDSTVYTRLIPKNSRTNEGKRHVRTVPVKLAKAQNNLHKTHPDSHFCRSTIQRLEELASFLGPNDVIFLSQDDKARVPIGITAANKQAPVVMHLDYQIKLPDHDWVVAEKHKLIPSVYAAIKVNEQGMGNPAAVTYSGPTYIAIRSGKHSSSTATTHFNDLQRVLRIDDFADFVRTFDGQVKPVLVLSVDGGPDENPRYQKVIDSAIKTFSLFNLDALFIATNAPGRSAYNRVERRMAPLSRELAGVILKHDTFGSHLNARGQTIDLNLEKKNFAKAGETLSEIWSNLVIDGYATTAEYISPNAQSDNIECEHSVSAEWRRCHVRESHYFLQIVKCKNVSCCGEKRSKYFDLIEQFLPPLVPISDNTADKKTTFPSLFLQLALQARQPLIASVVYDKYCPSLVNILTSRVCRNCGLYHSSVKSLNLHNTICKKVTDARSLSTTSTKIRPQRVAAKRQRELMVIWKTRLASNELAEHCDWVDEDEVNTDAIICTDNPTSIEEEIIPVINIKNVIECPWQNE